MDNFNIKFRKYLLRAGGKSAHIAIISELGRHPLYFSIIQNILLYVLTYTGLSAEYPLLHNALKKLVILVYPMLTVGSLFSVKTLSLYLSVKVRKHMFKTTS